MDSYHVGFKNPPFDYLDFIISTLKGLGLQVHDMGLSDRHPTWSRWRGGRLLIQRSDARFLAIVRPTSGRADRVLPMLAMSLMEASKASYRFDQHTKPLALLVLDQSTPALFKSIQAFADEYVEGDEGLGVVSMDGGRFFSHPELQMLSDFPKRSHRPMSSASVTGNLFSDTNQWLLKILFAAHIPEQLLSAPRGPLFSGRQLGDVAQVSHVSANRFLGQLKDEGFLDSTADDIRLIRHKELLLRWREASNGSKKEVAAQFLFRGGFETQLKELLQGDPGQRCLGLFAAADCLSLGHVRGVAPYVYVPKLTQVQLGQGEWGALMPTESGASPDLYIRQAPSPLSTFKGAVMRNGVLCADVLQVWLDVSYHPVRGQEQANLIYDKYLLPIFKAS
ncbi:hypothetical protein [Comamonas odontotermitis]|uniref:hypothetical protein n=1 Tax=Comamonas odontotermitis TaxID=379895 RepID=UPI003750391D